MSRLIDIKTIGLNIRDSLQVLIGIVQAWVLLGRIKPDVVFLKGGYVGVPIGLAAAARHIKIVTHDSDALPGLANRLVSRWASVHATALAANYYPYPSQKVRPVGVLVEHTYKPVNEASQTEYKKQLGLPEDAPLLLITGGSSGAQRINNVVTGFMDELLKAHPALYVIHQVGQGQTDAYKGYLHPRLKIMGFMKPMYIYTGAANLIVTRAGGNAMAEFGTQGKACVVIPNPDLTGGHQLKNATLLEKQGAAKVIYEPDMLDAHKGLLPAIEWLLSDAAARNKLATNLRAITIFDAAPKLAQLLLSGKDHV